MTGIISLGKNGLALYDQKSKGIFQVNFQPEAVKDLEIINPDQLNLQIKSFIDSNKIAPSPLIMIVSHNMFFEKDFPLLTKEQQEIETQKFLDNIPFEAVVSTGFHTKKGYKIIAANGHFIEEVKKAFQALGFIIDITLPSIIFGYIGDQLNQATIKIIFNKYTSLKQYSLLKAASEANSPSSQKEQEGELHDEKNNEEIKKKNLIAIGILVLFIVVLFIIVFVALSIINSS